MPPDLNKHFLIAPAGEPAAAVPGWRRDEIAGFAILRGRDLPLYPVADPDGRVRGAVIGWLTDEAGVRPDGAPLAAPAPGARFADWSAGFCGRFVCLLDSGAGPMLYPDAGGMLAAVYAPARRMVASIPTQITDAPDESLRDLFGVPERHGWYPFGLTPFLGVSRLMPDMALDLGNFTTRRFWPDGPLAQADPAWTIPALYAEVSRSALGLAARGGAVAHLTAGYDSRMILAATWPARAALGFVTIRIPGHGAELDCAVAARLAARFGLRHAARPLVPASPADMAEWHARTGACIADHVTRLCATIRSWDPAEIQIGGACGEVGRAFYWSAADIAAPQPSPDELLRRMGMPAAPRLREAAAAWIASLPPGPGGTPCAGAFFWDLAYIEQRLGGWAGPSVYGSTQPHPSFTPFNSRRAFAMMLSLPPAYRAGDAFCRDFNAEADPALNAIPFNRPGGRDIARFPKAYVKALIPAPLKRLARRALGR